MTSLLRIPLFTSALILFVAMAMAALPRATRAESPPEADSTRPVARTIEVPEPTLADLLEPILEREQQQLTQMQDQLHSLTDTQEILELQRRMEMVKLRTEREVLQLQMDRFGQRLEQVERETLKSSLEALDFLIAESEKRLTPMEGQRPDSDR